MARILGHRDEEPIEDLDAGVTADAVRGGNLSEAQILVQTGSSVTTSTSGLTPDIPAALQPVYNSLVTENEAAGYSAAQAQSLALQEIGL
jgi:hypothetical protein